MSPTKYDELLGRVEDIAGKFGDWDGRLAELARIRGEALDANGLSDYQRGDLGLRCGQYAVDIERNRQMLGE